ncbi:nuclear transport factor 2 family protein [Castellaniella caeni]|uniref:nuclear transport factor 2 family protein n=1 Tax=Castellaniella caeni TaxID=266123 RepID=UPI000C9FB4FA|nr:nuclear transport factor 2 family protein [Castellaniella caeni]
MSVANNLNLTRIFLTKLDSTASPDEVALLFTEDLVWNVPGDAGALPWLGKKIGRAAVSSFIRDSRTLLARENLEIRDILASDERAVIVGELKSRVIRTGKPIETPFSIVLTFAGDKIATYTMLEDSFAVSRAARTSRHAV